MSGSVRLITRIYRALLCSYPHGFKAEFGQEMLDVFEARLAGFEGQDGSQPWRLLLQEVRDWPGAVAQERLHAVGRSVELAGFMKEKPLTRIELVAALLLFVLPLISILGTLGQRLPDWAQGLILVMYLAPMAIVLIVAIVKGLPRWSLPYLGFMLMLLIILGPYSRAWGWIYPHFLDAFGPRSYWPLSIKIVYSGTFAVIMSLSTLLGMLILVSILRVVPYTRGVWRRARVGWTQLSFLLYGGFVLYVSITFEEYQQALVWQTGAWFCLALGAWFHLRATGVRQRILALLCGATGATWTIALAKWALIPLQAWPTGYPVAPSEATRWLETSSAMINWVCILVVLIAPALFTLLPEAPAHAASSEGEAVTA